MGMIADTFSRVALGQGLAPQTAFNARPALPRRALAVPAGPAFRTDMVGLAAPMQGGPLALTAAQGLLGFFHGGRA